MGSLKEPSNRDGSFEYQTHMLIDLSFLLGYTTFFMLTLTEQDMYHINTYHANKC